MLAEKHTQSELARKTSTPVSNVNRYLNGAKVPAEFCASLVREFGINPAWLLMGEGLTYLADVNSYTADMAGDLLEVVAAMNSVARMRLGSLTGRHHMKILRELNDAFSTYEDLRKRLNKHSLPILEQLYRDTRKAIDRQDYNMAEDIQRACDQVVQFCADPEWSRMVKANGSRIEFAIGEPEKALNMAREVFALTLTQSDEISNNAMVQAHNFVATLCQNYRFNEARRVIASALAIAGDRARGMEAYHELRTLSGIIDVECGDAQLGVGEVMTNFPLTSARYQAGSHGPVYRSMFLTGMVRIDDLHRMAGSNIGKARHIVRIAIWLEDKAALELATKEYIGNAGGLVRDDSLEGVQVKLLLEAMAGVKTSWSKKAVAALEDAKPIPAPPQIVRIVTNTYRTQLMRVAGDSKNARKEMQASNEAVHDLPSAMSLDMLAKSFHARNAMGVLSDIEKDHELRKLYEDSVDWFRQLTRSGYGFITR